MRACPTPSNLTDKLRCAGGTKVNEVILLMRGTWRPDIERRFRSKALVVFCDVSEF